MNITDGKNFTELNYSELMMCDGGGETWDAICNACSEAWTAVKSAVSSFCEGVAKGFNTTNIMNY